MKDLPGFAMVGHFRWKGDQCLVEGDKKLPKSIGLYAFVEGGVVRYVGSAKNLRSRLGAYGRRVATMSSKRPVFDAMARAMREGDVLVFIRPFERAVQFIEGLPIHMVLGLEAGLIATLKPEWNRYGKLLLVEMPVAL